MWSSRFHDVLNYLQRALGKDSALPHRHPEPKSTTCALLYTPAAFTNNRSLFKRVAFARNLIKNVEYPLILYGHLAD